MKEKLLKLLEKQKEYKYRINTSKESFELIKKHEHDYYGTTSDIKIRLWIGVTLYPLFNGNKPDPEFEIGKRCRMESPEDDNFNLTEALEFFEFIIQKYTKLLEGITKQLDSFEITIRGGNK